MASVRKLLMLTTLFLVVSLHICDSKSVTIDLDESNWQEILTGEWMVEFYAPWCPACKALQPVWKEFGLLSEDLDIKVGQVDVTSSPGLSGRFMVTALPTIFHVLDGEFRQYRGGREKDAFVSFIEDKKWKSVESIPGWKSPSSITMSIVSYFFKISQLLRSLHNQFMEEYGLPTWACYLIFAVATILFGAVLGLILVCVIDLIWPPKPPQSRMKVIEEDKKDSSEEKDDDEDEEEEDEDVEEVSKEDLEDEEPSNEEESCEASEDSEAKGDEGSPNVRKRKPRKVD